MGVTFVLYTVRGAQLRPVTDHLSNLAARGGMSLMLLGLSAGWASRAFHQQPWYWYHTVVLAGTVITAVGHAVMTRRVHKTGNDSGREDLL